MEGHANSRLVYRQRRHRFYFFWVTDCVGDIEFIDARDTNNLAGCRFVDIDTLETEVAFHLQNLAFALLTFDVDDNHLLVRASNASRDSANTDDANVAVVIECRDLHLQWRVDFYIWMRHFLNDFFK